MKEMPSNSSASILKRAYMQRVDATIPKKKKHLTAMPNVELQLPRRFAAHNHVNNDESVFFFFSLCMCVAHALHNKREEIVMKNNKGKRAINTSQVPRMRKKGKRDRKVVSENLNH